MQDNLLSYNEIEYLKDLVYNGFMAFEAMTERNLDDVICGICGVCPEICLGDGNEKNCCSNSQVFIIFIYFTIIFFRTKLTKRCFNDLQFLLRFCRLPDHLFEFR